MTIIKTQLVKQCGLAKAIKNSDRAYAKKLLFAGYESIKKADLAQLNHETSAEDLDFRKALFINYRFWMRDVKVAQEAGHISRQDAIDLATVMRSAAVVKIGKIREEYPAQESNLEAQLEDAEATLEQVINDYREANTKANYERSKRAEVSKVNLQLVQENDRLRNEVKTLTNKNAKLSREVIKLNKLVDSVKAHNQKLINQNQTLVSTLDETSEVIQELMK